MIDWFNKRIKRMDTWDFGLIKLSVAAFVLFVIRIWPAAMDWVNSVNPWIFFMAFVIFMISPFYKLYIK